MRSQISFLKKLIFWSAVCGLQAPLYADLRVQFCKSVVQGAKPKARPSSRLKSTELRATIQPTGLLTRWRQLNAHFDQESYSSLVLDTENILKDQPHFEWTTVLTLLHLIASAPAPEIARPEFESFLSSFLQRAFDWRAASIVTKIVSDPEAFENFFIESFRSPTTIEAAKDFMIWLITDLNDPLRSTAVTRITRVLARVAKGEALQELSKAEAEQLRVFQRAASDEIVEAWLNLEIPKLESRLKALSLKIRRETVVPEPLFQAEQIESFLLSQFDWGAFFDPSKHLLTGVPQFESLVLNFDMPNGLLMGALHSANAELSSRALYAGNLMFAEWLAAKSHRQAFPAGLPPPDRLMDQMHRVQPILKHLREIRDQASQKSPDQPDRLFHAAQRIKVLAFFEDPDSYFDVDSILKRQLNLQSWREPQTGKSLLEIAEETKDQRMIAVVRKHLEVSE